MRTLLLIIVLAIPSMAGCVADAGDGLGTRSSELEVCPDSAVDGAACMARGVPLACEREGDVLCTCDPDRGVWRCTEVAAPPPDACPAELREGSECERIGASCARSCDGAETCRCVSRDGMDGDPAGTRGGVWSCEGEPPPPPPGGDRCDMEWELRCREGSTMAERCVGEDGRVCFCEVGMDGGGIARCEGDPPPPPPTRECTEDWFRACATGGMPGTESCIGPDGRSCWCGGDGGVICEGDPMPPGPATDECTMEHFAACAAGRPVECSIGMGRCRCEVVPGGGRFVCEP
jgi:hypothetical protein